VSLAEQDVDHLAGGGPGEQVEAASIVVLVEVGAGAFGAAADRVV
jgi:hypothetical protein